ncbi:transporter substrate-binding domain-containing protein [Brevibacillus sp. B_LB10_24]|uniref:amino acid ABC transporter substrate-binding protein n=1 Tax=Brevibacillus sp. B_LB10_24 TaxID=3380645 RepID=UPI0038B77FA6
MRKLFAATVVASVLALALAGCGTKNTTGNGAPPAGEQATDQQVQKAESLLDKIKAEGKIKIGTEGTYSPFTFHDPSGKLTGFDVELATEVAKRMGVEPVFMETQWDAMFAGLDSERFDLIANEVGIRPDRQEKYDFSDPYITSPAMLAVHKDNTTVKDFADIKGLKAAQTMTSNLTDIARENGAEIVPVDGLYQAIDVLATKRVDVTINDGLSMLVFLKEKPETPIKIVAKYPDAAHNGFVFRKGNEELVEAVNKALDEIKQDGTYLKISEKWFGTDVSN